MREKSCELRSIKTKWETDRQYKQRGRFPCVCILFGILRGVKCISANK